MDLAVSVVHPTPVDATWVFILIRNIAIAADHLLYPHSCELVGVEQHRELATYDWVVPGRACEGDMARCIGCGIEFEAGPPPPPPRRPPSLAELAESSLRADWFRARRAAFRHLQTSPACIGFTSVSGAHARCRCCRWLHTPESE